MNNLVNQEALGQVLGVSRGTLLKLRKQGMPALSIGSAIRYSVEDVFHWINNNQPAGKARQDKENSNDK
jgi:DNA-binding XRE family transcriptional regulator